MSKKQRFVDAIIAKVDLSPEDKKKLKTGLLKASTESVEILMFLLNANVEKENVSEADEAAV